MFITETAISWSIEKKIFFYKNILGKNKRANIRSFCVLLIGWGDWDRTSEWRIQSPLPYRLATPQSGTIRLNEPQQFLELLLEE